MTDPVHPKRGAGRWILIVLGILAVAGLAFGIGRFTAFTASTVPPHPSSDSADAGFARDMQVHHDQAVEMAMIEFRQTSDDALRAISYDIATTQSVQRGEMFGWLVQWGLPQTGRLMSWMADDASHGHGAAATDAELRAQMGMATDAEIDAFQAATGTDADCRFLTLMTRHHLGALDMLDAIAQRGSDPRVLQVAASMKAGQTAEIDALRDVGTRLGCTP